MKYNEVMNNPAYMKYLRAINVVSYSLVLEFEDDGPICVKNRFGYNKIPLINLENGKETGIDIEISSIFLAIIVRMISDLSLVGILLNSSSE